MSVLSFEALSDSYAVREVNKTQFDFFFNMDKIRCERNE